MGGKGSGWKFTEFPHLLYTGQHDEIRDIFLRALREQGGRIAAAAEYIGIDRGSYYRYARAVPGLLEEVQRVRDEFRVHKGPRHYVPRPDESEFGRMVRESPGEAKELLLSAYEVGGGVPSAAKALGISARRVHQYLRQFELFPEVQRATAAAAKQRLEKARREGRPPRAISGASSAGASAGGVS